MHEDMNESLSVRRERGQKRKFALGLLMLAPVFLLLLTLAELVFNDPSTGAFWRGEQVWFFSWGCLLWGAMGLVGLHPTYLYVLAHEMTHALTSRFYGGRIVDMKVSSEGGYIDTDKTNTLITLSPYLVPLYATIVICLYGVVSVCFNMETVREYLWMGPYTRFKMAWVFYFLIGLTWCFHATFTIKALMSEQSDLIYNGEFFSMILILLVNLMILAAFYIAASPHLTWVKMYETMKHLVTLG